MSEDNAGPNPAEEARRDISKLAAKAVPDPSGLSGESAVTGEPEGDDTGSPAGWGADADWSSGDARPEPTRGDPS
jgi:hypothetical protein